MIMEQRQEWLTEALKRRIAELRLDDIAPPEPFECTLQRLGAIAASWLVAQGGADHCFERAEQRARRVAEQRSGQQRPECIAPEVMVVEA